MKNSLQVIILAAGYGKRMGNKQLPKILLPFKGKPIIKHLLKAVEESGYGNKLVIVIGQKAQLTRSILGNYPYIYQKKQLGTGHAVLCCKKALEKKAKNIMVLYGDHPLLTSKSITRIIATHLKTDNTLTMATVKVLNFNKWRKTFFEWGRIIRDKNGYLREIVEMKDANKEQKQIAEVNPSFFCFKASWLWKNLVKINNNNAMKEYYLTDLLKLAVEQKEKIATVGIKPAEAYGINTSEQLIQAKTL